MPNPPRSNVLPPRGFQANPTRGSKFRSVGFANNGPVPAHPVAATPQIGAAADKTTAAASAVSAAKSDTTSAAAPKADPQPQKPPPAPIRQPAKMDKTRDAALPKERDVTFTPSSAGIREQLTFAGGGNPTVTVDGKPASLDANGTLALDVPARLGRDRGFTEEAGSFFRRRGIDVKACSPFEAGDFG